MGDYDLKLAVSAIRKARFNFALYQGEKADQVLITPGLPKSKLVLEIEKSCGKTKRVCKGLCFFEADQLVFAVKSPPSSTWDKAISTVFREQKCAKHLPIVLRQLGPGESDEVSSEETAGIEVGEETPQTPQTPQTGEGKEAWLKLKAELTPRVGPAAAARPEIRGEVAKLLSEAIGKERAEDFAGAIATFDGLSRLIGAEPKQTPSPSAGPDGAALLTELKALAPRLKAAIIADPGKSDAFRGGAKTAHEAITTGQFPAARAAIATLLGMLEGKASPIAAGPSAETLTAQLKAMVPQIKEAMAAKPESAEALRGAAKTAQQAIAGGQLAEAQAALGKLLELLNKNPPGGAPSADSGRPDAGPRAVEKLLPVWRDAKDLVGEQLTKMESALRGHSDDLVRSVADLGLHALTDGAQVRLQIALTNFDQAEGSGKERMVAAVRKATAECRRFLQSHPALPLLENNPLDVTFTVRESWGSALDRIDATLGALEPALGARR